MSLTATRGLWQTTATTANPHDIGPQEWKPVDVSNVACAEYAPVAELHCADLAAMPIFLSYDQAAALDEICQKKLSGPRGKMELLPQE